MGDSDAVKIALIREKEETKRKHLEELMNLRRSRDPDVRYLCVAAVLVVGSISGSCAASDWIDAHSKKSKCVESVTLFDDKTTGSIACSPGTVMQTTHDGDKYLMRCLCTDHPILDGGK